MIDMTTFEVDYGVLGVFFVLVRGLLAVPWLKCGALDQLAPYPVTHSRLEF